MKSFKLRPAEAHRIIEEVIAIEEEKAYSEEENEAVYFLFNMEANKARKSKNIPCMWPPLRFKGLT